MTADVFTYGVLMSSGTEPAVLDGWRLTFAGFATVVPDPHGRVYGVLVRDADLGEYDRIEGVESGFYARELVTVTVAGPWWNRRRKVRAWVYVMSEQDRLARAGRVGVDPMWMREQYIRVGHPPAARLALMDAVGMRRTWDANVAQ